MERVQRLKELRIGSFVNSVVGDIIYCILSISAIVVLTFKSGFYYLALFMIPAVFVALISLILAAAQAAIANK